MPNTPHYAFILPTIGGDLDNWGAHLNANWASADTAIKAAADAAAAAAANAASKLTAEQVVNLVYPVGALYLTVNAANPGTIFAGTTWVAKAQGRALIGVGTADGLAWAVNQVRGTATVTLTSAMLPSHVHNAAPPSVTVTSASGDAGHNHSASQPGHSHDVYQTPHNHGINQSPHSHTVRASVGSNDSGSPANGLDVTNADTTENPTARLGVNDGFANISLNEANANISLGSATPSIAVSWENAPHTHQVTVDVPAFDTASAGGGAAHDNVQPSIAIYIWERTA